MGRLPRFHDGWYLLALVAPVILMVLAFAADCTWPHWVPMAGMGKMRDDSYYRGIASGVLILGWPVALVVLCSRLPRRAKLMAVTYIINTLVSMAIVATV